MSLSSLTGDPEGILMSPGSSAGIFGGDLGKCRGSIVVCSLHYYSIRHVLGLGKVAYVPHFRTGYL